MYISDPMKLKKNKSTNSFDLCYQINNVLSEKEIESYVYIAKLDKVNRNHEFGRDGYDQGAIDFRRTYCSKSFSINKKSKNTSYLFSLPQEGCYEIGELISGTLNTWKKIYYILDENGNWQFSNKNTIVEHLEKERKIFEKSEQKKAERRLKAKQKLKQDRMKKNKVAINKDE